MDALATLLAFFLGSIVASFATVLAERIHTGERWMTGRSRCNSCGRHLTGVDLIPIVSWLLDRGRCRSCGARVPAAYALIEGATGVAFALALHTFDVTHLALPFFFALSVLSFVVAYDIRHTIIPWSASALLIIFSLTHAFLFSKNPAVFGTALMTAGAIGGAFLLMHLFSRGKAMGLADAPLSFSLSLLAAPYAVSGLLFSFWIGAVWGIGVLVTRRGGPRMGIEIPFAPFLALGYLLAHFIKWNPLVF